MQTIDHQVSEIARVEAIARALLGDGATIDDVGRDAEGYEAQARRADGSHVVVRVDETFDVVNVSLPPS